MSEDNYNERFGACRSCIETQFSEFEQKFGLFGPTKVMCITNMKVYNVMFKVAIVLYNFYRAETVFEDYIDILLKHKEWTTVNFDFLYNGEIGLEEETARVEFEHQRITAMQNSQHQYLESLLIASRNGDTEDRESLDQNNNPTQEDEIGGSDIGPMLDEDEEFQVAAPVQLHTPQQQTSQNKKRKRVQLSNSANISPTSILLQNMHARKCLGARRIQKAKYTYKSIVRSRQ